MKNRFGRTAIEPQDFLQEADHFSFGAGRFNERFWVDATYATSKSSPVLFYLCGEAVCREPHGFMVEAAKSLKATMITLEHRYYGKSQPFAKLSTNNLRSD